MKPTERKKRIKRIKDIASRLSDEGLERLFATAEAECGDDPDCQGSGNPGPGEPPPPPPNP